MKTIVLNSGRLIILAVAVLAVIFAGFIYFQKDSPIGAIINPQQDGLTAIPAPSGTATSTAKGSLPRPATYYFKVTSVDYAGGQTMASPEFTCRVTSPKTSCTAALTISSYAASSRIWIGTSTGVYYGYKTATSSTLVATTTGMTAGSLPQVASAYMFNSGVGLPNTWLKSYATADTLVKSGPTIIHSVTISSTDAAATAGTIVIRDGTTGTGATTTAYGVPAANIPPSTIILDQVLDNGLYIDFYTTADVNVSVSYK